MHMWGKRKQFPLEIRPVLKCQRLVVTELLRNKYGLEPPQGHGESVEREWQTWLWVLGKQRPVIREALLTMRTFLGCGIAGLAAFYIAPALRNRYFVSLSVIFLIAGCHQALDLAMLNYEPMRGSLARLASLLAELSDLRGQTKQQTNESEPEPSKLAIITDEEKNN